MLLLAKSNLLSGEALAVIQRALAAAFQSCSNTSKPRPDFLRTNRSFRGIPLHIHFWVSTSAHLANLFSWQKNPSSGIPFLRALPENARPSALFSGHSKTHRALPLTASGA